MRKETSTKKSYDATAEAYAKKVADHSPKKEKERFLEHVPQGGRILDVGCGSGRDARYFSDRGFSVVGIDFSAKMIEIAMHTAPLAEFVEMDIEAFVSENSSFDGVWANASLLHIAKRSLPDVLRKIYLLLNATGYFYLSLKKGSGEGIEKDARYGNVEKYWVYFEEPEIRRVLEGTHFQVLEIDFEEIKSKYQTHPFLKILCKKSPL